MTIHSRSGAHQPVLPYHPSFFCSLLERLLPFCCQHLSFVTRYTQSHRRSFRPFDTEHINGAGAYLSFAFESKLIPLIAIMFRQNQGSLDRKPSKAGSKNGLRAIASKLKPDLKLAVDTDVSRHHGYMPKQVFPRDESCSHGVEDTCPRPPIPTCPGRHHAIGQSLRSQLENRTGEQDGRAGANRAECNTFAHRFGLPPRPDIYRSKPVEDNLHGTNSLAAPPLHNRIRGLRPSPLTLDISPSDRVIPIGISIPSASISNHTTSPLASTPEPHPDAGNGHEATTPTIVITPARESFDLKPPTYHFLGDHNRRPASSVYSRYTNCAPRTTHDAATPPVPPLPLFAQQPRKQTVPESRATLFEDLGTARSQQATLSVCTVFEEDEQMQQPQSAKDLRTPKMRSIKRQSTLPTPRRSRGWWNVITSPFSARSNIHFWRSPSDDTPERNAILEDAGTMGVADVAHVFRDAADLDEPLSAPDTQKSVTGRCVSKCLPKRSITAPGALDPSCHRVNIYRIPSQGAAAAYYDESKHFPSLIIDPSDASSRSIFEDDSPLTDVCACENHRHIPGHDKQHALGHAGVTENDSNGASTNAGEAGDSAQARTLRSPFDDTHAIRDPVDSPITPPRTLFTSPTADELQSPSPAQSTAGAKNRAVTNARLSTASYTPVMEDAHAATMVGPRSAHGEQMAVFIPPSRAPSPTSDRVESEPAVANSALDQAGVMRESLAYDSTQAPVRPPMHEREGSRGLGISNSELDLFPPPKPLSEKPRLGTDRFGQLVIVHEKDDRLAQPAHRRFLWPIIAAVVSLLLLMVVLLVVFVPRTHSDNPVQAQWLNLTGFPALPTGVATVVQPKKTRDNNQCIDPPTLWSCSVPQSQQSDSEPESTNALPDFRFEIRFRNHTLENSTALAPATAHSPSGPAFVQSRLRTRSAWSQTLYWPSPAPPSKSDQLALGSSVDGLSEPYNGEETPFYLSLLDPVQLGTMRKRDETTQAEPSNPYPYPSPSNASSTAIPKPRLLPNGRPGPELAYPFARSQPLRLYNRGQDDEHYGFSTYFDKSVPVTNSTASPSSTTNTTNAGLTLASSPEDASALCTFTQTRLHVQIWTGRDVSALNVTPSTAVVPASNSSANVFDAAGSFPYAVTISLDRHSGPDVKGKGVFCWALDDRGKVVGDGVRLSQPMGDVEKRDDGQCGCRWDS